MIPQSLADTWHRIYQLSKCVLCIQYFRIQISLLSFYAQTHFIFGESCRQKLFHNYSQPFLLHPAFEDKRQSVVVAKEKDQKDRPKPSTTAALQQIATDPWFTMGFRSCMQLRLWSAEKKHPSRTPRMCRGRYGTGEVSDGFSVAEVAPNYFSLSAFH